MSQIRVRVRVEATAIRRGFELYECHLVIIIIIIIILNNNNNNNNNIIIIIIIRPINRNVNAIEKSFCIGKLKS